MTKNSNAKFARALAALGHEKRLEIYRLLVKAGEKGLNVGELGSHIGVPASTMAHHISALVDAGLVLQERHGRQVINKVDYPLMHATVSFLTEECCCGVEVAPTAA